MVEKTTIPILDTEHELPKPQLELPAPKKNNNFLILGLIFFIILLSGVLYFLASQKKSPSSSNPVIVVTPVQSNDSTSATPVPSETRTNFYFCTEDSDCISVASDICGCNQGGRATAINKENKVMWDAKLSKEREGKVCPQFISQDPSCSATPKCVDNSCKLIQ